MEGRRSNKVVLRGGLPQKKKRKTTRTPGTPSTITKKKKMVKMKKSGAKSGPIFYQLMRRWQASAKTYRQTSEATAPGVGASTAQ